MLTMKSQEYTSHDLPEYTLGMEDPLLRSSLKFGIVKMVNWYRGVNKLISI